jgi:hypothetical protein
VDFVKVQDTLPRDLYFAIADQAKREHLPLAGHIPPSVLAAEVADAGQVSVEHLGGQFLGILLGCSRREEALHARQATTVQALRQALAKGQPPAKTHLRAPFARAVLDSYDDQKATSLFRRFARRGTWQCPTLVTLKTLWESQKEGLSEEDLDYGARVYAKDLEVVRSMHRARVRFLAGTDGPYTGDPFALHDELALLVEGGLTPLEALQTATRNPAAFFGELPLHGTVARGRTADLVLLEANPLEDIRNTRTIAGVVVRGRFFTKSALREMAAATSGTPLPAR